MKFEIRNYSFSYGKVERTFTVQIDDFFMEKGSCVFIFGDSGSCKSTFFNLLSGIINTTLGEQIKKAFPGIEYIMHECKLLPWHTLRKNVQIISNIRRAETDLSLLKYYCNLFNLPEDVFDLKSWQLSLGMRQRFEIALALSNNPQLIILDEGLSGIDIKNKGIVCQALYNYVKDNDAVLLGTAHQISDILRLAERVYVMKNGTFIDNYLINTDVRERISLSLKELYALPDADILLERKGEVK